MPVWVSTAVEGLNAPVGSMGGEVVVAGGGNANVAAGVDRGVLVDVALDDRAGSDTGSAHADVNGRAAVGLGVGVPFGQRGGRGDVDVARDVDRVALADVGGDCRRDRGGRAVHPNADQEGRGGNQHVRRGKGAGSCGDGQPADTGPSWRLCPGTLRSSPCSRWYRSSRRGRGGGAGEAESYADRS